MNCEAITKKLTKKSIAESQREILFYRRQRERQKIHYFKFLKDQKRKFKFRKKFLLRKISIYSNKKKMLKLRKSFSRLLHIRVNPNNIFFNLKRLKLRPKTLTHASSGLFKIKLTKKRLSHNVVFLLDNFLSHIRSKIFRKNIIIVVIAPKNLKFKIVKSLSKLLKNRNLIVYVKPLKCFNGCRPPKKRRRKQKGLRLVKK